jgi:hypothetical protein
MGNNQPQKDTFAFGGATATIQNPKNVESLRSSILYILFGNKMSMIEKFGKDTIEETINSKSEFASTFAKNLNIILNGSDIEEVRNAYLKLNKLGIINEIDWTGYFKCILSKVNSLKLHLVNKYFGNSAMIVFRYGQNVIKILGNGYSLESSILLDSLNIILNSQDIEQLNKANERLKIFTEKYGSCERYLDLLMYPIPYHEDPDQ